jgi:SAM-dependent methyltransferase/tetratricopeptide (TPR) repeat protein
MNTDLLLAQKLYEGGDDTAAQEKCLTLLDNNETASDGYLLLSQISFEREDYDTSLKYLSEAEEKNLATLKHHYLAGLNHYARNDFPRAKSAFEAVLTIDPKHRDGLRNLGVISKKEGSTLEAVSHFCDALTLDSSDELIRRNLFDVLKAIRWEDVRVKELSEPIRRHVEASLNFPEFDITRYIPVVATLVFSSDHILLANKVLGSSPIGEGVGSSYRSCIVDVCRDALLQELLRSNVLPLPAIEVFLTGLRRVLLEISVNERDFLTHIPIQFCVSMAHQAYLTEYAYETRESELLLLKSMQDELSAKIKDGKPLKHLDRAALAISAAYISLDEWIDIVPDALNDGPLSSLFEAQIHDKRVEARLLGEIEVHSPITDKTSIKVRNQYEENPFPRWARLARPPSRTIGETLQILFPYFQAPAKLFGTCSILIAGCGTGQHPIMDALRYPDCQLTAIDLSLQSLASAMRRSKNYEVSNLRLLHGDILNFGERDDQYDVISCTGVLHHMADPVAGWRALLSRLSPGGVMKIGVYSELARRHVAEVRQWISQQNLTPTEETIRETRHLILNAPPEDAKRNVLSIVDFYSISGARDLLFHAQENTFSFPKISGAMDTLGLEFIGLQLSRPEIGETYKRMFPGDPNMTNFHNWHDFEKTYPDSFSSMYQFWCRRSG